MSNEVRVCGKYPPDEPYGRYYWGIYCDKICGCPFVNLDTAGTGTTIFGMCEAETGRCFDGLPDTEHGDGRCA